MKSILRRTKIVATLGPATDDPKVLTDIVRAGVDFGIRYRDAGWGAGGSRSSAASTSTSDETRSGAMKVASMVGRALYE